MRTMRSAYAGAAADKVAGPSPCKDCTDRFPGCGGSCEQFKAWKDKRLEVIRSVHQKAYAEGQTEQVRRYGMERTLHRKGEKVRTGGR